MIEIKKKNNLSHKGEPRGSKRLKDKSAAKKYIMYTKKYNALYLVYQLGGARRRLVVRVVGVLGPRAPALRRDAHLVGGPALRPLWTKILFLYFALF